MDKSNLKHLFKYILWGIIWSIAFVIIALIIVDKTQYILKDVLFIEGIIVILLGALSLFGGNSMGLSLQALGQTNAQYVANANLEVTKKEKELNSRQIKDNFRSSVNTVSLIVGGTICIIINFII